MLVRGWSGRRRRLRSSVVGDRANGEWIMTEATGGDRAEMERRLIQRSLEDEAFRQSLLDDPKGTMEQELGSRLPEGVEVRAVEETAETIYLVLPSASPTGQGGELSDQQLEAVAGGQPATDFCTDQSGTVGC
jgi:Nitrile hydratase, alpha chain